jgi:hypothetical protein
LLPLNCIGSADQYFLSWPKYLALLTSSLALLSNFDASATSPFASAFCADVYAARLPPGIRADDLPHCRLLGAAAGTDVAIPAAVPRFPAALPQRRPARHLLRADPAVSAGVLCRVDFTVADAVRTRPADRAGGLSEDGVKITGLLISGGRKHATIRNDSQCRY